MELIRTLLEGIVFLTVVIFTIGFSVAMYKVEWVMPSTFETGIIKVDEYTIYKCVPTKKTIEARNLQRKLRILSKVK